MHLRIGTEKMEIIQSISAEEWKIIVSAIIPAIIIVAGAIIAYISMS